MDDQAPRETNSFLDMLENLGIDDPRLRLMAEMMSNQKAQSNQPSAEQILAKKKRVLAKLEKFTQENSDLQQENQLLHERLALLAEALGACPLCWGEDNSCLTCYGRGVPGSFMPNRNVFDVYVLPAVRTIHRYTRKTFGSGSIKSTDKAPQQLGKNPSD